MTETEELQEEYWTAFRDRIEERETQLSARKPYPSYYHNLSIGKSGFELQFTINTRDNELGVGIVIRDDADAYWQLEENRDEIDRQFDQELVWDEPEETRSGKKRSRIWSTMSGDVNDEEQWDAYLDWMIENGEQFYHVFYDRLQQL
ncbi:DUF4268 domain-containing protein [Natrinema pallidum]|uniref:DUF4268 domain-containing protein n=1 Tax=Natrinema pallidum DSM 3751 TaxID=1227495 RepID=L9YUA3_9EURY|nr:DUF4268 domain-containing protein [Natrinema pallidum]ELY77037.1 hypothetical protein C487_09732 [Natrinema pallidum DSM 3751]